MADQKNRWPENAAGRYYVDDRCIASKFCTVVAPANFVMAEGHAYVVRQPATAEEDEQCRQAMAGCPVNAIGDDGP